MFNPFVDQLTEDQRLYGYFQQGWATAYTALSRVHDVFAEERTINWGSAILWALLLPDLSPNDFNLWDKLKSQSSQIILIHFKSYPQIIENGIAAIP